MTASSDNPIRLSLDLGQRGYDILIGPGLLARAPEWLKPLLRRPRVFVITDETVGALHLAKLRQSLEASGVTVESLQLPPGEATKSFDYLSQLCRQLLTKRLERSDLLVALGGGVIGDLVGFAAAILLRGIDFVQIPTTLLAQVDSSVGGKTAIDVPEGKNLVGAFHQPRLVLADTEVLATLPPRELRAGYAEVVKYGLLGDPAFFAWLEDKGSALLAGDETLRRQAVHSSCQAKAAIVARDETESGERALLNLGHTFGHALETLVGYDDRLKHGEAVAIGMAQAFRFSAHLGLCSAADAQRAEAHLAAVGLPVRPQAIDGFSASAEAVLDAMTRDKKVSAGKITLILLRALGQAFITRDVEPHLLLAFLTNEMTNARRN